MPIVKVHVSSLVASKVRELVINDIRNAIVEHLGVTYEHAYVMIYDTSRSTTEINDRSNNHFIFVETFMFTGRSDEVKANFFGALARIIQDHIGIEGKDVFFNIIDSDRNNWAGKDGVPFSKK